MRSSLMLRSRMTHQEIMQRMKEEFRSVTTLMSPVVLQAILAQGERSRKESVRRVSTLLTPAVLQAILVQDEKKMKEVRRLMKSKQLHQDTALRSNVSRRKFRM